ncbi:hypothetical protein Trydic_g20270, partial [Trypoxylus dichotomus]
TEAEKEKTTTPGRITTRTAAETSPDMERKKTSTATTTETTTTATTSKQQTTASGTLTRSQRRGSNDIDTTEAIRLLQTALGEATESSASDMEYSDDNSTIGNTTDDAATDPDGFRPPSRRQQRKRKGSSNSDSDTRRKRSGAKLVPTGGTGPQPVPATAAIPKAKEGRVPPVVLREKARWTTLNSEILRRGIRTTKVVNTNVGIRIQPTTADDYRQLVQAVTALNMQFHSYQLTEDKPLKIVLRGVPEDITEEEISRDLARQGIQTLECKRMLVGQARRPIPLVFVQLTKSDEAKGIFKITHVCGINISVESKQAKKGQVTQCHRCQLYGHGQRNCHAAAVCVKCAGPHQTAECSKSRDTPARCALCQGPHTANYKGCPKSPYVRKEEVTTQPPRKAAPKPAQRPAPRKPEAPKVSTRPAEKVSTPMEVDTPQPSTSTAKTSYAAAVKKGTTKAVKPTKTVKKTPKKGKTPSAPSLPKPSPKKPVASKPPTKPTPAIVEEVVDYDASETTSRPEANALDTLSQLIPLIQKINWQKLLQVAATLVPKLLKCRSMPEAGLLLAGHLHDILAIFSHNE